ncbi:uncharacterized protein WCC33_015647 [Rhinophrynus dorsalis]
MGVYGSTETGTHNNNTFIVQENKSDGTTESMSTHIHGIKRYTSNDSAKNSADKNWTIRTNEANSTEHSNTTNKVKDTDKTPENLLSTSKSILITALPTTREADNSASTNGLIAFFVILILIIIIIIASMAVILKKKKKNSYSFDLANKSPESVSIPLSNVKQWSKDVRFRCPRLVYSIHGDQIES